MFLRMKRITTALKRKTILQDKSIAVRDKSTIDFFNSNPNNPYLVSFPRTGSHWLRMLAELYFERPSLVRVFYYPDQTDYLMLHTHDLELDVERRNVIYLYRDPVDTVYSQLNYYQEDLNNVNRIAYWGNLYGQHLDKWLFNENFTTHKTILTYEQLRINTHQAFSKFVEHFGEKFDADKFDAVSAKVTKEEVKKKTAHDEQVVKLNPEYNLNRDQFREQFADIVWEIILKERQHLKGMF